MDNHNKQSDTPSPSQHLVGIAAAQITMGRGLVDVTRIEHEGRSGILFRPRNQHIPIGDVGELPAGGYWPVEGDVVIWIENESGAKVIQKYLTLFLPPAPDLVGRAADAYVAELGIEHSGGIIERSFEAGALWNIDRAKTPYGYVFGGCTFLRNESPLVTEYIAANSLPVFLHPAENVLETYKEVMADKIGDDMSTPAPQTRVGGE